MRAPRLLVSVAALAVLAAGASARAAQGDVTLSPTALGNIFTVGATPSVDVTSGAGGVLWTVTDYWGRRVAAGQTALHHDRARLRLPIEDTGHYTLSVTPQDGGAQAARTELAVLPAPAREGAGRDGFVHGVQTHFGHGWDVRLVGLLRQAGVERLRDAQQWQEIETSPGGYDFSVLDGRYQTYMDELAEHGIDIQVMFGLNNAHHDGGATPYTDAGRAAYARFVAAVVDHYGRQIEHVGVVNEPNLPKFGDVGDGPADARPDYHARIAADVYRAVEEENPAVRVAAPELLAGTANSDEWLRWLEEYFALGGLDFLDVVSLHPYRKAVNCPPTGRVWQPPPSSRSCRSSRCSCGCSASSSTASREPSRAEFVMSRSP